MLLAFLEGAVVQHRQFLCHGLKLIQGYEPAAIQEYSGIMTRYGCQRQIQQIMKNAVIEFVAPHPIVRRCEIIFVHSYENDICIRSYQ